MFSTLDRLKQRTPAQGINRQEYIGHLVDEFHTTTDIEAQEQVTANLANFAYDPINWKYLRESEALDLFMQLVYFPNQRLQLHGLAGLCNICLDPTANKIIANGVNLKKLVQFFTENENQDIALNCVTLFYQLLKSDRCLGLKAKIATTDVLKHIIHSKQRTTDARLSNLCKIFLEDFGTRNEIIELESSAIKNVAKNLSYATEPTL